MESLFILIPLAIVIVALGVAIFFWAVNNGQFDDLDAEGKRILFDDNKTRSSASNEIEAEMTKDSEK